MSQRHLLKLGADVAVGVRRVEDIERVADEVRQSGRRCVAVKTDMLEKGGTERLVQTCVAELGGLTIMVNNVGENQERTPRTLMNTPREIWDQPIELNLTIAWLGTTAAAPHIAEAGNGAIINVASVTGISGAASFGP